MIRPESDTEADMDGKRSVLVFLLYDSESAIRRLAGVMLAAKERDWRTHIVPSADDGAGGLRLTLSPSGGNVADIVDTWRPDGCVMVNSGQLRDAPRELAGRVPVVFADLETPVDSPLVGGISTDNAALSELAARELFRSGYRDYAYVPYIEDKRWSRERGRAFERIVSGAGKRFHGFPAGAASPGDADPSLRERLLSWLAGLPKPAGVFASNSFIAAEVLKACSELGLAVPGAVAVIGVDNPKWHCENTRPSLSCVSRDYEAHGAAAVGLLEEMMERPGQLASRFRECAAAEVVRRESTTFGNARDWRVSRMLDHVRTHACDVGFSPRDAVAAVGRISRTQADHLFRAATGHSLLAEIHAVRLARAKELLADGKRTDFVALECGYSSENDFRRVFSRHFGMTPRKWALHRSV